ncbi:GNAT family N-acetyltransferase [Streptomyces johnsoniae]|uniref:GNAT family N-acetyltransferase n=1 Tax=Streptomyces johnsoniae TaxID=3075532 RepID=A0ABU2S266_9ACTN|nr:GNAT family N-acetyltransferase [Streptomyces sp. DSM 41886]MDT0443091.1 GNAT family N-acetyltransferase [Streptomyces sp. DSM 41886]
MGRPRTFIDCGDFFLRRWRADRDAEPLFRLIEESLGHLGPWMPWVSRHSRETTRAFLAGADRKWRSGDGFAFAIGMGGRLVGSCALYRAAEPRGRVLGYWLHPAATGRGVATRAAAALASEAFALSGVAYVEIVHDVANTASGAVPRRLGFAEVRRVPVTPPAAPSDRGIDVVWRLARPAPPRGGADIPLWG